MPVPQAAKLIELDILKELLPISIWEREDEKNKHQTQKGKLLRSSLRWKLLWLQESVVGKVRVAPGARDPHTQDPLRTHKRVLVSLYLGGRDLDQTATHLLDQELYPSQIEVRPPTHTHQISQCCVKGYMITLASTWYHRLKFFK